MEDLVNSSGLFMMLFYALATLILGTVCFQIFKNTTEWLRNNQSPRERCAAKLVAKRTHVFGNEMARTNYYVTFEWEGKRQEFRVRSDEFALLAEGATGGPYIFRGLDS